jgi:hypothetical protein
MQLKVILYDVCIILTYQEWNPWKEDCAFLDRGVGVYTVGVGTAICSDIQGGDAYVSSEPLLAVQNTRWRDEDF